MIRDGWEQIFKTREWGIQPSMGVVALLVMNYYHRDRKEIKVLDLGCGPGANLWYLAAEGYDAYGIDGSPTALKKAAQTVNELGMGKVANLHEGDMAALPYTDNIFDLVIDIQGASCSPKDEMQIIFSEVHRVLKPGGLFYSEIFSEGTDPCCLQDGAPSYLASEADLKDLYQLFKVGRHSSRTRPFYNKADATREWLTTAQK